MDNIWTIRNETLQGLDSNAAVEFFRELIWAQAGKVGIPPNKINISTRVNVPDGGVDASVDTNLPLSIGGLDFPRNNGHKKCPDGVDYGHQEKRNGRAEVSKICQGIQAGSVGIAEAWG